MLGWGSCSQELWRDVSVPRSALSSAEPGPRSLWSKDGLVPVKMGNGFWGDMPTVPSHRVMPPLLRVSVSWRSSGAVVLDGWELFMPWPWLGLDSIWEPIGRPTYGLVYWWER